MARRKSAKKPVPKKRLPKLDTSFTCPFCNHPDSVECTIDKQFMVATVECCICNDNFSTVLTPLTEAIDVYHDWLDALEAVNAKTD